MLTDIQYNSDYANYIVTDMPIIMTSVQSPENKSLVLKTKKYDYNSNGYNGSQAVSIARRNARERSRVKQVNDGFNALRKRLPASVIAALSDNSRRGSGKKLSKVDTLRMVVEYIKYLQRMVEESDEAVGITSASRVTNISSHNIDNGFEASSVYSDLVPSPASSEYSSGLSMTYSSHSYILGEQFDNIYHTEEDDISNSEYW